MVNSALSTSLLHTTTILLPPFRRLTQLKTSMSICTTVKDPEAQGYNQDDHIHQILWLVRLNITTLTHLALEYMDLVGPQAVRHLCRTVSQLHHLRALCISAQCVRLLVHGPTALERLFLSCPGSLVMLKIGHWVDGMFGSTDASLDPVQEEWDFDQGPLVLRATPLYRLRQISLPRMVRPEEWAPILRSFLKHCPIVETLHLPRIDKRADGINSVLASIGDLCPCVSNLSCLDGCFGEHVTTIMKSLPQQCLESLVCRYANDLGSGAGGMSAAWTQHSTSLRQVELVHCSRVESAAIQAALTVCRNLEIFTVTTNREELSNISITLADAVQSVWVCTNIREFRIAVWITPDGRDPECMKDSSKISWTQDDHQHWDNLGRFYSQIESLTHLEILDLKAVGRLPHRGEISSSNACLPGLLALEDPTTGQIGYLSSLSGLTKLRELRGSVVWTNIEARERIGEREVNWFVNNLPALKLAMFVGRRDYVNGMYLLPAVHQNLSMKRPGLKLVHYYESYVGSDVKGLVFDW